MELDLYSDIVHKRPDFHLVDVEGTRAVLVSCEEDAVHEDLNALLIEYHHLEFQKGCFILRTLYTVCANRIIYLPYFEL